MLYPNSSWKALGMALDASHLETGAEVAPRVKTKKTEDPTIALILPPAAPRAVTTPHPPVMPTAAPPLDEAGAEVDKGPGPTAAVAMCYNSVETILMVGPAAPKPLEIPDPQTLCGMKITGGGLPPNASATVEGT